MSPNRFFRCSALVAALLAAPGAHATLYDISADFSTAHNPNGVWRYGFELVLGGPLVNYDVGATSGGIDAWRFSATPDIVFHTPVDYNNPTGAAISGVPAHTAAFHPGSIGEYSVYEFITPSTGTYDLFVTFGALAAGGTDVHVLLNGSSLYSHEVDPGNTPESFSARLALTSGNRVDFAVGVGTDGNFSADGTSINASLTSIPEPATLALFGAALAALLLFRGRRPTVGAAA